MGSDIGDVEMTLNGVFCVVSPNSIALEADYVTVVEDRHRPIMSAEYPIPLLAKFDSRSSRTASLR